VTFVGYVPDLMDRSKLGGVRFVGAPGALLDAPETEVVVDLGRPGVLDVLPELTAAGRRVVGFCSHVDRATIDAAKAAGCEALPRSELFRRWPEIAAG
jgi:hypothetical protein